MDWVHVCHYASVIVEILNLFLMLSLENDQAEISRFLLQTNRGYSRYRDFDMKNLQREKWLINPARGDTLSEKKLVCG